MSNESVLGTGKPIAKTIVVNTNHHDFGFPVKYKISYSLSYNKKTGDTTFLDIGKVVMEDRPGSTREITRPEDKQKIVNDSVTKEKLYDSIRSVKAGLTDQQVLELNDYSDRSGQKSTWTSVDGNVAGFVPPKIIQKTKAPTLDPDTVGDNLDGTAQTQQTDASTEVETNTLKYYAYPSDMFSNPINYPDHMVFERFEYRAPFSSLVTTQTNVGDILRDGLQRGSALKKFMGMARLPMPNQLSAGNAVNWGGGTANTFTTGALAQAFNVGMGALNQSTVAGGLYKAVTDAFGSTGKALGSIGKAISDDPNAKELAALLAAQFALGQIGINADPNQFISRARGRTINPNLELLFSSPKLRSFEFDFDFAPNNPEEAEVVRKIQRWFKVAMSPRTLENNPLFLGSPNVFRLRYRTAGDKRIKGLNMFKVCALTNVGINYTPDGTYQSYADPQANSMPVRTKMKLSFSELTPIFDKDYKDDNPIIANTSDPLRTIGIDGPTEEGLTKEDVGF